MTAPKASIIVPSRGGAERLPFLFESLRTQTEASWEAIVVIDGDIDDSASVVDSIRDELPVSKIVFPENRGRSAALNTGFAAAQSEVLIRCDDDLRPRADYVAQHIAQHSGSAKGAIGLYRNEYPPTAYARAYGYQRDDRFRVDAYASEGGNRWRYWAGNVSVTRETFERVGGYDTVFRAYGWEDVDWGYRLSQAGAEIELFRALETPHHVAAVTTEIRVKRAFYAGAAKQIFTSKHGDDVLGLRQPGAGIWGKLIDRTGSQDGLRALLDKARRADARLDRLPRWFAEKQVAWLVESAALSGELHPEQVVNDV